MKTNVVELVEQVRSQCPGTPVVVSECYWHRPRDKSAWVWIFAEDTKSRLEFILSGVLARQDVATVERELAGTHTVWRALLDTNGREGSRRIRLLWTLPPAPCRVYKHRRLRLMVEPSWVKVRGFWRHRQIDVYSVSRVEGWVARGAGAAGITLRQNGREGIRLLRLMNNVFAQECDPTYDAIDLSGDTGWLGSVTPRIAGVFGTPWCILDYTESPPAVVMSGQPGITSALSDL